MRGESVISRLLFHFIFSSVLWEIVECRRLLGRVRRGEAREGGEVVAAAGKGKASKCGTSEGRVRMERANERTSPLVGKKLKGQTDVL